MRMLLVGPVIAGLLAMTNPAHADHVAPRGISDRGLYALDCEELYVLRNTFFHEKGLCFTRPTAVKVWGNRGCKYENSADLPMSQRETEAVAVIVGVERDKRCPRY